MIGAADGAVPLVARAWWQWWLGWRLWVVATFVAALGLAWKVFAGNGGVG